MNRKIRLPLLNSNPGRDKRLRQELMEMQINPPPMCSAKLKADNLYEWEAIILGPPQSVYEGGKFTIVLKFLDEYPFRPPEVYFTTKIYHCNVSASGHICLDILSDCWSPAITVPSLLLSICSLLTDPNPDDPMMTATARLYKKNRAMHDLNARSYTAKYAKPKSKNK